MHHEKWFVKGGGDFFTKKRLVKLQIEIRFKPWRDRDAGHGRPDTAIISIYPASFFAVLWLFLFA